MEVYESGHGSVSIYISTGELSKYGINPDTVTAHDASEFLKTAAPLHSWSRAILELYKNCDGIMVFARRASSRPLYYGFSDFEALLSSIRFCSRDLPSSLMYSDGQYILTVFPWLGDPSPFILSEFGTPLNISEYWAAHMNEHGYSLIKSFAIAKLLSNFAST